MGERLKMGAAFNSAKGRQDKYNFDAILVRVICLERLSIADGSVGCAS